MYLDFARTECVHHLVTVFPCQTCLVLQGRILLCLYKCLTEQMNLMAKAVNLLFVPNVRHVTEDDLNVRRLRRRLSRCPAEDERRMSISPSLFSTLYLDKADKIQVFHYPLFPFQYFYSFGFQSCWPLLNLLSELLISIVYSPSVCLVLTRGWQQRADPLLSLPCLPCLWRPGDAQRH